MSEPAAHVTYKKRGLVVTELFDDPATLGFDAKPDPAPPAGPVDVPPLMPDEPGRG